MGRWRDLVVEEDLAEAGWRVWEGRREKRGREEGLSVVRGKDNVEVKKKR